MENQPRNHHRQCYAYAVMLVWATLTSATVFAQQLTVGSVLVKLGEPDSAAVKELRKDHKVERIDGGWSVQPAHPSPMAPGISLRTVRDRIESVLIIWGPGFTPPVEEVVDQLAHALPDRTKCEVRNVLQPHEGGEVRTLEWLCDGYKVGLVLGRWKQGNSATISLSKY